MLMNNKEEANTLSHANAFNHKSSRNNTHEISKKQASFKSKHTYQLHGAPTQDPFSANLCPVPPVELHEVWHPRMDSLWAEKV
jgi:hypothetical protein